MTYCGRKTDIEMIKFLETYYDYTSIDILNILFNNNKSLTKSEKMYTFIFNNYIS